MNLFFCFGRVQEVQKLIRRFFYSFRFLSNSISIFFFVERKRIAFVHARMKRTITKMKVRYKKDNTKNGRENFTVDELLIEINASSFFRTIWKYKRSKWTKQTKNWNVNGRQFIRRQYHFKITIVWTDEIDFQILRWIEKKKPITDFLNYIIKYSKNDYYSIELKFYATHILIISEYYIIMYNVIGILWLTKLKTKKKNKILSWNLIFCRHKLIFQWWKKKKKSSILN